MLYSSVGQIELDTVRVFSIILKSEDAEGIQLIIKRCAMYRLLLLSDEPLLIY